MELRSTLPKLTAIIVDDELHGRENLKKIIETYCPEIDIKGTAESVITATELVKNYLPEVVFLDINMPILDGFDFLEIFEERNFMVVFVSAHQEFGINAVKTGAVDYILKPINIKELKLCVNKLLSIKEKNGTINTVFENDKISIPTSHGFRVLLIQNMMSLEADGCYTTIVSNDNKSTVVTRTLKDFELALPKTQFFRIHKSHIINLKYIKDYSNFSGNHVTLTDGRKIEISRRRLGEFRQQVRTYLNAI
ncbi:MAG: LytTR family DNA-binding domain-containing protein [Flavobacteriaceae bacterium]